MGSVHWLLIGASILLSMTLVGLLFALRKLKKEHADELEQMDEDGENTVSSVESESLKKDRISLLDYQIKQTNQAIHDVSPDDKYTRTILRCWKVYLEIERDVLEANCPPEGIEPFLAKLAPILNKVEEVRSADSLVKQLASRSTELRKLNRVVASKGDGVLAEMNQTADLTMRLEKMHDKLHREAELDAELGELRAEVAKMYELEGRIETKVSLLKTSDQKDQESYRGLLEDFLGSSSQSDFLAPVREELDDKIAELKRIAAHQAKVIKTLKMGVKRAKTDKEVSRAVVGYDIPVARLEKSLLEHNKVVKRLEQKLQSLQTIKYNLSVDIKKRDEIIRAKDSQLKRQLEANDEASGQGAILKSVFRQEHDSVQNMQEILHQFPLTVESERYTSEQGRKIDELKHMINESELYVEVLEKDLDAAKQQEDDFEAELEEQMSIQRKSEESRGRISQDEQNQMDNLLEMNRELEVEIAKLSRELSNNLNRSGDCQALRQEISEIDLKIKNARESYVQMEEKYLSALMMGM